MMRAELNIDTQALVREIASEVVKALQPLLDCKMEAENKLFTVEDLCDYLQVDKGWVYQQVHSKTIPYLKANGHLRFRKSDIDKYLLSGSK